MVRKNSVFDLRSRPAQARSLDPTGPPGPEDDAGRDVPSIVVANEAMGGSAAGRPRPPQTLPETWGPALEARPPEAPAPSL